MSGKRQWTDADILMLLGTMQRIIPKDTKSAPYTEGLKDINWKLVAFYPFTPSACEKKWNEIFESLNKIRTVAELLTAAEVQTCKHFKDAPKKKKCSTAKENDKREQNNEDDDDSSSPSKRRRGSEGTSSEDEGLPPKPPGSGYVLFSKEKMKGPGTKDSKSFQNLAVAWRKLSVKEKDRYKKQCKEVKSRYRVELNEYLRTLNVEQQLSAITIGDLKKTDIDDDIWTSAHTGHVAETSCKDKTVVSKRKFRDPMESSGKINPKKVRSRKKKWLQDIRNEICPVKMNKWLKNCNYLDVVETTNKLQKGRTSDSEDEDFEDMSDEEENAEVVAVHEEEEEEEQDDIMFDIY